MLSWRDKYLSSEKSIHLGNPLGMFLVFMYHETSTNPDLDLWIIYLQLGETWLHDMAILRENPGLVCETSSGLHVKSHDQLKGAVRE